MQIGLQQTEELLYLKGNNEQNGKELHTIEQEKILRIEDLKRD